MTKYIFVTGGVVSSLGKGIATASIGLLLKKNGFKVSVLKIDPYLNVDPGTMNPYQHGEVFVTEDGAETDLDLGHYERFMDTPQHKINNTTTGQIYYTVISNEREGKYLGNTVQVVPHITNEIKQRIIQVGAKNKSDVVITEIGGTVGDIESEPYLEAIRQLRLDKGKKNTLYIHLTLVPYVPTAGEFKTKPSQHSVKELQRAGIQPDIILCRSERPIPKDTKGKIALYSSLEPEAIIEAIDRKEIYEIPLVFKSQKLDKLIMGKLNLDAKNEQDTEDMHEWEMYVNRSKQLKRTLSIAIVGKYIHLKDAYKSVIESLKHAANHNLTKLDLKWIEAEDFTPGLFENIPLHGILVPGGFGTRGIEGKIKAITYARVNKIPYLGLCVGMQCAVIEFARNVIGLKDANSTEFNPQTEHPVIFLMPEQKNISNKGGTMRLGSYEAKIKKGTKASEIYKTERIVERHRHRYEFNNQFTDIFERNGMVFSAINTDKNLVELIEIPSHPFFMASQFHPEFLSRPLNPHPLFFHFIKASLEYARRNNTIS